jgi:hypothetical protein
MMTLEDPSFVDRLRFMVEDQHQTGKVVHEAQRDAAGRRDLIHTEALGRAKRGVEIKCGSLFQHPSEPWDALSSYLLHVCL